MPLPSVGATGRVSVAESRGALLNPRERSTSRPRSKSPARPCDGKLPPPKRPDQELPSRRGSMKMYNCPHREDTVHHDEKGCTFSGTLAEVHHHSGTCPYKSDEISSLAFTLSSYFQKYPKHAPEARSMVRESIDRLHGDKLDERTVEVPDKKHRIVTVRGLCMGPMMKRLAAAATNDDTGDAWHEFRCSCLRGFEVVEVNFLQRKGSHVIDDMLTSHLREDTEAAKLATRAHKDPIWYHSRQVWMDALVAADAAPLRSPPKSSVAIVRAAVGVTGSGGGQLRKVLKAFREWDMDGSGSIDSQELLNVLRGLDLGLSDAVVQKLFAAADVDSNGVIDYAEFVAWIFDASPPSEDVSLEKLWCVDK